MPPGKKKLSKFDQAALAIAEGIANIPYDGKKRAARLLKDLENRPEESQKTQKPSAKIRTEVKKKTSAPKSRPRKKK